VKEQSRSGPSCRRMSTARCTLLMAGNSVGACVQVWPQSLEKTRGRFESELLLLGRGVEPSDCHQPAIAELHDRRVDAACRKSLPSRRAFLRSAISGNVHVSPPSRLMFRLVMVTSVVMTRCPSHVRMGAFPHSPTGWIVRAFRPRRAVVDRSADDVLKLAAWQNETTCARHPTRASAHGHSRPAHPKTTRLAPTPSRPGAGGWRGCSTPCPPRPRTNTTPQAGHRSGTRRWQGCDCDRKRADPKESAGIFTNGLGPKKNGTSAGGILIFASDLRNVSRIERRRRGREHFAARAFAEHHAKSGLFAARFRQPGTPIGRAQEAGLDRVAPAADDTEVTIAAAERVGLLARLVWSIPVRTPLGNVAVHVEKTPCIRRCLRHSQVKRSCRTACEIQEATCHRGRTGPVNRLSAGHWWKPGGNDSPVWNSVVVPARQAYSHSASVGRR